MGNSLSIKKTRTKGGKVKYKLRQTREQQYDRAPNKTTWEDIELEIRKQRMLFLPLDVISLLFAFANTCATLHPLIGLTFLPYLFAALNIVVCFYLIAKSYILMFIYGVIMILYCGITIFCIFILLVTRSSGLCSGPVCAEFDSMMVFYVLLIFGTIIILWYLIQGCLFWRKMLRLYIVHRKSGYRASAIVLSRIGSHKNGDQTMGKSTHKGNMRRKNKRKNRKSDVDSKV